MGILGRRREQLRNKREQEIDKILADLCQEINELPRGYGSSPTDRNKSYNGYYNTRYTGFIPNDQIKNAQLFKDEEYKIFFAFHSKRKELERLCGNDLKLIAKVKLVESELYERAGLCNLVRTKPFEFTEKDKNRLIELELKYGNKRALEGLVYHNSLNAVGVKDRRKEKIEAIMNCAYMKINLKYGNVYNEIRGQGCSEQDYPTSVKSFNAEKNLIAEMLSRARKELDKLCDGNLNYDPNLKGKFNKAYLDLQERADLRHEFWVKGWEIPKAKLIKLQKLEWEYRNYSGSNQLKLILNEIEVKGKGRTKAEELKGMSQTMRVKGNQVPVR